MSELGLLGMIVSLHVLALAAGAVLVLALARSSDGRPGAGSDGPQSGGGPPPPPPTPPPIGPPLPDAAQSRVRLREAGRIADRRSRRHHEPAPARPTRRGARRASTIRQQS
jgi:hypothetical protein